MKKFIITITGERIEDCVPMPQPQEKDSDELGFVIPTFREPMRRYVAFRRSKYRNFGRGRNGNGDNSGLFDTYHDLWNISSGDPVEASRLVDIHIREGFHSLRQHHTRGKGENFKVIDIELKKKL